jgi:hypothetical protein
MSLYGIKSQRNSILIVIVGVAALVPAMLWGIPASRDLQHHFRLALTFFDAIHDGNFYPSWLAEANNGYGDLSVRFYPPGLYYLLAFTRAMTGDWYAAALVSLVLLTITGGFGAYWWARTLYPGNIAVWAGILYILAPYHINELYQSSLLAEYAAAGILPFAFAFTERVCQSEDNKNVAGLAASYALLMLTHLPLTVIGSYALLFYLLVRIERQQFWKTVQRFTVALVLGIAASSCFWMTVIAELPWLRPDNEAVFSINFFIFSTLRKRIGDTDIWYGNLIALMTMAMALPALALVRQKSAEGGKRALKALGLLAGFSFLMTTLISFPLWEILPKMKAVQLPWRWLAVTSMAVSVLVAGSIPRWKEIARGRGRPVALIVFGAVLISLSFTLARPILRAMYLTRPQFLQVLERTVGLPSIGPWYPRWVGEKIPLTPEVVKVEQRPVNVLRWKAEHRTFAVGHGAATEARVRTFYYPLWTATVNGQALPTRPSEDGALLIALPPEAVSVELKFSEPMRSRVSAILSVIGWLLIGAFLFWGLVRGASKEK